MLNSNAAYEKAPGNWRTENLKFLCTDDYSIQPSKLEVGYDISLTPIVPHISKS